jgi:hypothetical protein
MAMPPSIHLSCRNHLEANFAKGKNCRFIDSLEFEEQMHNSSNEILNLLQPFLEYF